MVSSNPATKRKSGQLDEADDTPCKKQHRDLRLWNNQKVECCLSCGSFYTLASDLHKPFKFSDEIRLLWLLPSTDVSTDLVGELCHVRLQEHTDYEAVSYTWADESGNTSHSGRLFIKSTSSFLRITKNCDLAFRKFRKEHQRRLLWIDSVCIDQQNSLERSEQVQMMTAIYKQARRVVVFIGNPPDADVKLYRQLFEYIKTRKELVRLPKGEGRLLVREGSLYNILSRRSGHLETMANTLIKFLAQSWFHRIWIIQEVMMARKAILYFGPCVVDWEDMTLHHSAQGPGHNSNNALIPVSPTIEIYVPPVLRLHKGIQTGGARLIDLLSATRACAATDPRDKIFALLGMAHTEKGLTLPPVDYTKSVGDVYAEATTYHIRITERLDIFSLDLLHDQNTPSWVSDFSNSPNSPTLPIQHNDYGGAELLSAASLLASEPNLEVGLLSVTGIRLDVITHVQNDANRFTQWCPPPADFLEFSASLQESFQTSSPFHVPLVFLHCLQEQHIKQKVNESAEQPVEPPPSLPSSYVDVWGDTTSESPSSTPECCPNITRMNPQCYHFALR